MKKIIGLISILFIFTCGCQQKERSPIKGFMIDAARDVEKMEYYYRLVDFFSERGFNTLMFRLTDDEGCAMKFESHPELITHPGAYSKEELKKFIAYAHSKNIMIIPEVETFGHTKYITKTERWSFLKDYPNEDHWENAICPVSDSTLFIMNNLLKEVAELFPSEYIHIGCDEADWGAGNLSKEALKTKSKNQIVSEYINALNANVNKLGKTSIMWSDLLVGNHDSKQKLGSDILELLHKNIVIMDWDYWSTNEKYTDSVAHVMIDKGFHIIGAPAANWFAWGSRIGSYQLENLSSFSKVYNKNHPQKLGIMVTHWGPKRYIQNGQWDTYALVANIVNHPDSFNFFLTLKAFNESYYGIQWNNEMATFYKEVYDYTPSHKYLNSKQISNSYKGIERNRIIPWKDINYIKDHIITRDSLLNNHFSSLSKQAKEIEQGVTKNKEDFHEFVITLEFIAYMIDRDNMMWQLCKTKASMKEIIETLNGYSDKDSEWVKVLDSLWNKGRTAPMSDSHLWDFPLAAKYLSNLASTPDELLKLIEQ